MNKEIRGGIGFVILFACIMMVVMNQVRAIGEEELDVPTFEEYELCSDEIKLEFANVLMMPLQNGESFLYGFAVVSGEYDPDTITWSDQLNGIILYKNIWGMIFSTAPTICREMMLSDYHFNKLVNTLIIKYTFPELIDMNPNIQFILDQTLSSEKQMRENFVNSLGVFFPDQPTEESGDM